MILELLTLFLLDKSVHDFGRVYSDKDTLQCHFVLTNNDTVPLFIDDIRSGCPCLKAYCDNSIVEPLSKSTVTVVYSVDGDVPEFQRSLYLKLSNCESLVKLSVVGSLYDDEKSLNKVYTQKLCSGSIGVIPDILDFGQIRVGRTSGVMLRMANLKNEPVHLKFIHPANMSFSPEEVDISPLSRINVRIFYTADDSRYGIVRIPFVFELNGIQTEALDIKALVTDDFSSLDYEHMKEGPYPVFDKTNFKFTIPYGQTAYSAYVEFRNNSSKILHIRSVFSDSDSVSMDFPSLVEAESTGRIKVTFKSLPTSISNFHAEMYMVSDSPLKTVSRFSVEATREKFYCEPISYITR